MVKQAPEERLKAVRFCPPAPERKSQRVLGKETFLIMYVC